MAIVGTVYLLHFQSKLSHAQHYIGWTKDLHARLDTHTDGNGAKIVRAAASVGIYAHCVRTWVGTRRLERRLKSWKKARQLCPTCRGVEEVRAGNVPDPPDPLEDDNPF